MVLLQRIGPWALVTLGACWTDYVQAGAPNHDASIEVKAAQVTGRASPLLFGHFIEHEYSTIQGEL
jgi:hypothetical protein